MRFIDKLKTFFFNEQQVGIINIGDLIQIPGREYFKDNKEALELIEEYKKECLEILSQNKTIVTKDISSKELINKKDMYINLLLNIVMKEDYYTYENQELLDNKIILLKLKLYLEAIIKIENETIARLIALLELEKSKKVPIRNRNTLNTEIDNLKISLYTLISQKASIKTEIDNYLTHISISDNRMYPSIIEKRRDKTIKYASYLMNVNEIFSEKELSDNNIYKQMAIIALLESKIEEYLYLNKSNMWYLNSRADSIKYTPDLNYREAKTIKSRLLHDLSELEEQYNIYHKFGRNLVKYEDWYRLYSAKFRILTFDIAENYDSDFHLNISIFKKDNPIEQSVYESIIFKKKEDIRLGKNAVIKELYEDNDKDIIKLLSSFFKWDSGRFEYDGIETYNHSIDGLRLLLALDSKNEFIRLLNRECSTKTLPDNPSFAELKNAKIKGQFVFNDRIPIYTILEVMGQKQIPFYYECLKKIHEKFKARFGSQYCLLKDSKISLPDDILYILPEGIKRIEGIYYPYGHYAEKVFIESIGKIIVMPNSLISIKGALFDFSPKFEGTILNDGIKEICYNSKITPTPNVFDIPSSLEDCDKKAIDLSKTQALRFKDYKNSKILYDPLKMYKLLSSGLMGLTLSFRNKRTYHYGYKIDAEVEVVPISIDFIFLEENGKDVIKIDLKNIKCYGTLKNQEMKKDKYNIDNILALRFAKMLIAKIILEEKKLESNQKVLTKVKKK